MSATSAEATATGTGAPQRLRVLFVTPSLRTGGAERFLLRLGQRMTRTCDVSVVNLGPVEDLTEEFLAAGIAVHSLGLRHGIGAPIAIAKAIVIGPRANPDVIQVWMYYGDIVAACIGMWSPRATMFGSLRNTSLPRRTRIRTAIPRRLARLANQHVAVSTIACSDAATSMPAEMMMTDHRHPQHGSLLDRGRRVPVGSPDGGVAHEDPRRPLRPVRPREGP